MMTSRNIYENNIFKEINELPASITVYLFGAGLYGRKLRQELNAARPDIRIKGFIDSRKTGSLDGLAICPLAEAAAYDAIIAATPCWHGMGVEMLARGVTNFFVVRGLNAMVYTVVRSPGNGLIYSICSRTGSTSLISAMSRFGDHRFEVVRERQERDGDFAFTFVRNPFDRVVSCFHGHCGNPPSHLGAALLRLTGKDRFDFAEFVRFLAQEPGWGMDNHLRPYSLLVPGWIDFVGRLEDMADGVKQIQEKTGVALAVGRHFQSNRKQKDYRPYYTPELRHIVEKIYADDLARYGYAF